MKSPRNQSGFVSIMVSMIIMIILTVITIGFVNIMGREQRQAIDRQISAQAFYAAESGVNDAATQLKLDPRYRKTADCGEVILSNPSFSGSVTKELDPMNANTVRSTCVTVDPDPDTLVFSPVSVDLNRPTVTLLRGVDENNSGAPRLINTILINWSPVGNSVDASGTTITSNFVPLSQWDSRTGMIKVTLVRFTPGDSRETIVNNSRTIYLRPIGTSPLPVAPVAPVLIDVGAIGSASSGNVRNGSCSRANPSYGDSTTNCTALLDNINDPSLSGGSLFLVMSSLYRPNNVYLEANGGGADFSESQAVIDSTGRNGDVLRRIQVRRSLRDTYDIPGGGLVSDGAICKLTTAAPSPASTTDTVCGF